MSNSFVPSLGSPSAPLKLTFSWTAFGKNPWKNKRPLHITDLVEGGGLVRSRAGSSSEAMAGGAATSNSASLFGSIRFKSRKGDDGKSKRESKAMRFVYDEAVRAVQSRRSLATSLGAVLSMLKTLIRINEVAEELALNNVIQGRKSGNGPSVGGAMDFMSLAQLLLPDIWGAIDEHIATLETDVLTFAQELSPFTLPAASRRRISNSGTGNGSAPPRPKTDAPYINRRFSRALETPRDLAPLPTAHEPRISDTHKEEVDLDTVPVDAEQLAQSLLRAVTETTGNGTAKASMQRSASLSSLTVVHEHADKCASIDRRPKPLPKPLPSPKSTPRSSLVRSHAPTSMPPSDVSPRLLAQSQGSPACPLSQPLVSQRIGVATTTHARALSNPPKPLPMEFEAPPGPITELAPYLRADGCVDVRKYVRAFEAQVESNVALLDELELAPLRNHLQALKAVLENLGDPAIGDTARSLLSQEQPARLRRLYAALHGVRAALVDQLNPARARWTTVSEVVGAFHADTLGLADLDERLAFWAVHEATLAEHFGQPGAPSLPVQLPDVRILRKEPLMKVDKYEAFVQLKEAWEAMRREPVQWRQAQAWAWPIMVPNVSAADLKPALRIASLDEHRLLCAAWNTYLDKLLRLTNWWALVLRTLCETLDALEPFGPEAHYRNARHR